MSKIRHYIHSKFFDAGILRGKRAFATVLVLLVLVLLSVVVIAFLTMSQTNRGLSSSTAATVGVEVLSRTALDTIQADLLDEITSNSTTVGTGTNTFYVLPKVSGTGANIATAAVPQRVVATSGSDLPSVEPNVVKISRVGVPAWYLLTGSSTVSSSGTSNGPVRVLPALSGTSRSDAPSANGVQITPSRWVKPMLFTSGTALPASFTPPDWVILTGTGAIDTRSGAVPPVSTLSDPNNSGHALGRYAYVIYDVGGLIDITVAGNQLGKAANGVRFRENQIPLGLLQSGTVAATGTTNSCILDGTSITSWRDTQALASGTGYLLGGTNTYATIQAGQQTFVSRQDLINFQKKNPTWMTPAALQYLTVFSRSLNRPLFTAPAQVKIVASGSFRGNPTWPDVSYTDTTTYQNPKELFNVQRTDSGHTGEILMKNRFPLSRLALFNNPTANAPDIKKYFGLERAADNYSWVYTGGTSSISVLNTPILTLAQVAALPVPREPNFFEVLQAAILNGSLAQGGRGGWWPTNQTNPDYYPKDGSIPAPPDGEASVQSRFRDNNLEHHVLQIGANLIDQVDTDDYPTIIKRELRGQIMDKNGNSITNKTITADVAGIENIPYISDFILRPYRLSDANNPYPSRQLLSSWFHFEFWNPHQNATQPIGPASTTPQRLRVVMTEGKFHGAYEMQKIATNSGTMTMALDSTDYTTPTSGYATTPDVDYYTAYKNDPVGTPYQVQFDNSPTFSDPQYLMSGSLNAYSPQNNIYYAAQGLPSHSEDYPNEGPKGQIGILAGAELVPEEDPDAMLLGATPPNAPPPAPNPLYSFPPDTQIFCVKVEVENKLDINNRYSTWEVQFLDSGGNWHTYQRFADFARMGNGQFGTVNAHISDRNTHNSTLYTDWTDAGTFSVMAPCRLDPRGERFGMPPLHGSNINSPLTASNCSVSVGCPDNDKLFFANAASNHSANTSLFPMAENLWRASPNLTAPYMADHDGVIRHGDLDTKSIPANKVNPLDITDSARLRKRPVILNRPFQSVGEMGYAFRDDPWKTIDFSSGDNPSSGTGGSGDAALLDFFTCEDPYGSASSVNQPTALLRGKVNLNTQQPAVLQTLLNGGTIVTGGTSVPTVTASQQYIDTTVTSGTAINNLVNDLVKRTKVIITGTGVANVVVSGSTQPPTPLATRGDLVAALAALGTAPPAGSPESGMDLLSISPIKAEKEVVARTLTDLGDTQTWNLMVDVIVQGGRYPSGATTADAKNFIVDAERRYWLHVAIDRYTGRVVESHLEAVDE